MMTHTATNETKASQKPKKKQNQPRHHAPKGRVAVAARRKQIINALLDGKESLQAGIEAGLSPKTAQSQISQILNNPKTQDILLAAMTARGMGADYFAEHHQMLIEGTKIISANVFMPGSNADLKEAGSMTKDFIEVPDFVAKAKGLDMVYRLLGRYKNRTEVDIKEPVNIIIKKFCSRTTAQDAVGLD